MNSSSSSDELIDRAWIEEMMIRWQLAELALDDIDLNASPTAPALRRLIDHDFPLLVRELIRLRPELDTAQ
jgi:hypothetical protein